MASNDDLVRRALELIANSNDPKKLRKMADNAKNADNGIVREAALRKLYEVSPSAQAGTLEHAVWQSIYALEDALTEERGRTTRLARTRQKIAREGELKTVADLVTKAPSEGYRMLIERGWPELTFEFVAIRHSDRFEPHILEAATGRLNESGVQLPQPQ
jgi:hypothetical protein